MDVLLTLNESKTHMTQAIDYGEKSLIFNDTAELFEAHRSSLLVHGKDHPVT